MDIKKVAVIGAGGVAGLASIFELLRTNSDGSTSITEDYTGVSKNPYFTKIVGFEQKSNIGGTWETDSYIPDPELPPQEILNTENYDNVHVIKNQNKNKPSDEQLLQSSFENPIKTPKDDTYFQWDKSGIYPRLYTNVPESYLRYSTFHKTDECPKGLDPFITHQQLHKRMSDFVELHSLDKHIRFNTEVYNVTKQNDKWILTLRVSNGLNKEQDLWYQETFDGVILAQGSFAIPYIPVYKGLSQYVAKYPGSVLHSKAYRDPLKYKDKRVVIVGGNISAIDIGQYLSPITKETLISRDLSRDPYLKYMERCIKAFKNVPLIQEFLPETKQIRLTNGELLEDVDHVILATGYHIELPFLEPGVLNYSIPPNSKVPTSNSRVKGLYQHIFNVEDPSIVFVGKLVVQTLFRSMEAQAAAVAGIWSGASKLPSKEEQLKWEQERLEEVDEHLFHKYDIYKIKEVFFDPIKKFHTKNRPDPILDLLDDMSNFECSLETFERVFNEFKDGVLDSSHEF